MKILPVATTSVAAVVVSDVLIGCLDVGNNVSQQLAFVGQLVSEIVPFQKKSKSRSTFHADFQDLFVARGFVAVGPR